MKNLTVALSLAILALASCSESTDKNYTPAGSATTEATAPAGDAILTTSPEHPVQDPTTTPSVIEPQTVTPSAPAATASGMNPPHGEPGHRCDISVGAPLSSAPTQAAPQSAPSSGTSQMTIDPTKTIQQGTTQIPAQAITPSAAPATTPSGEKTVTAPGMNPPHGEPGHDCAVAVGAPLPK